ncbi:MAG: DUF58 domain-containing protein [Cytophagaceae bacterium]|nr:DUF58 domain-containing protein [Cytophagaceae bacterium]
MSFLRSIYFKPRVFYALTALIFLFLLGFVLPWVFPVARVVFFGLIVFLLLDGILLYAPKNALFARRELPDRLSNGDDNPVQIFLENRYTLPIRLTILDELPVQFQKRDAAFNATLQPGERQTLRYDLRPTRRGEYQFGTINLFAESPLGLIQRRYRFSQDKTVAVYPSYLQMRQYELMAHANRLNELGVKRVRRIGTSREFEQIRPYSQGDDVRTINWRATARRSDAAGPGLMVNAFQDEKSQAIYCLIDKGRVMKMPFGGLSLLDYAINATLVLSNIALLKQDKAGVVTFAETIGQWLPADRRSGQLQRILNLLYRQKTRYPDTDYEALYLHLKTHLRQRSLLLLFTNFETVTGLRRQLTHFRRLAKDHLLIVVFFENTELRALLDGPAPTTEAIYLKTIAEKYFYEKQQMVRELAQYGIQALLTPPEKLTVNALNKYLEMKARGLI